MTADEIRSIITSNLACTHCETSGDGRHWDAIVISQEFEGKRSIQRHQRVYATMGDRMKTDEVHALSIKAYTPAEWAELNS